MKKSKKILIIILISVLLIAGLVAVILILNNKEQKEIQKQEEEAIINAEENFKKLFYNLEYSKNENEAVTLLYKIEKTEQGKFDIDVNIPLLNIETEVATEVNNEIDNIFIKKLYEVVKESTVYTKYNIDYIAYTNNDIISLIIKATLKEGNNPQRLIVQTYNYNLKENKLLNLEEYIDLMNLNKSEIQTQIINYIREKSANTDMSLAQEYNLYIRDVRSEEYLTENVKNYYIGQDGKLYIIFAYGNTNYTETVDVIIVYY